MVHFRCLAVAVALCYEVNAGPCRPRSSSGIATTPSTELTDNPASSIVLSATSSDALGETTLSTVLGISTTTSLSTSMVLSLDSAISRPSDTTLAYGSSVSTDPSSPASTSALFSSVEEVPSSDTSATSAAAITTALTTTTTTAEPNEPTNYFINGGFEIPDESGEYTGAPSLLGRSVTIKTDSSKALSGSHYAEVAFPLVGSGSAAYAIRQSIADLDPAKRYAYTYNYAPADMVASGAPPNPIIKFTTLFGTKAYETDFSGAVSPQDSYVKRKIVFDGITSSFVQTQVQFSGLNRGSVRFDDISIFEYDPPCTLVSPAPSDKWCSSKGSVYSASNQQKTIGLTQSLSLEDCAQSCHLEPTCQVISYVPTVGNNIGRCWRYKVPREDIEYVQNGGGQIVYEPGCFSFKE
ncbi:hypothetical protein DER44DRAFT_658281 [Fusarium oxysporum]|nr:hypothetical protein DER44DRAFT_658281 [Fusarium oxysporum]